MKIIFLDIDGVLNVYPQGHDQYGALFHKHFRDNLERLIQETDAKIVISSTWRSSGLDTMKRMWEHRGLAGKVLSITPNFRHKRKDYFRGEEIQAWINRYGEMVKMTKYCIIDDDTDFLPEQMDKLVKTSGNTNHTNYVDVGYGLTKECTDLAIKILNE